MAVGSKSLSPEAMDALKSYPWPGNVRELENTLKSLMITNVSNLISLDSFPGHLMKKGKAAIIALGVGLNFLTRRPNMKAAQAGHLFLNHYLVFLMKK